MGEATYISKIFLPAGVVALLLVACGDSGSGKDSLTPEEGGVETIEDLPNCSKAREGDSVLVGKDSLAYVCHGGKWASAESADGGSSGVSPTSSSAADSLQKSHADGVETIDDLLNCSKNREGDSVFVAEDSSTYICRSGKWEEKKYLIDSVKTEDDLPACTKSHEGDSAYVSGEYAVFVCSGNVWKKDQSIIQVYKSADDMPNCTKKLDNVEAVSTSDSALFLCDGERWQEMATTYASAETLPNCTEKREGNQAFLLDTREKFQCIGKQWKSIEEWSDAPGSSASQSSSSEGSSAGSSPSSAGTPSSSGNGDVQSSASQGLTYETSCGTTVHYTTATAGPNLGYGKFGYVVPLKISASGTQELYLAFDQAKTSINGPDEWNYYGVLITKYDSQKMQWTPGTEVFSKEKKSARSISGETYSTVNTYGYFEKFTFDTKGTWLAESSGKTVNVVVTFYAPGIQSESSGMGWDYFSIPILSSGLYSGTTPRIYYSTTGVDCYIPVSASSTKTLTCSPGTSSGDIYQGEELVWSVSGLTKALVEQPWFSVESEAGNVIGVDYGTTSGIVLVAYPNDGQFNEFLTISTLPGQKVQCKAPHQFYHSSASGASNDLLYVLPLTELGYCSCVADKGEIVPYGTVVTWTVKGCKSPNPITEYEWSGAQPKNETTATVKLTEGGTSSATPSVKVWDSSGDMVSVTCPKVAAVPYVFTGRGSSNSLTIPAGTHMLYFEINDTSGWNSDCDLHCSVGNYTDEGAVVSIGGDTYRIGYDSRISLPESYCKESSKTEITTTVNISCNFY